MNTIYYGTGTAEKKNIVFSSHKKKWNNNECQINYYYYYYYFLLLYYYYCSIKKNFQYRKWWYSFIGEREIERETRTCFVVAVVVTNGTKKNTNRTKYIAVKWFIYFYFFKISFQKKIWFVCLFDRLFFFLLFFFLSLSLCFSKNIPRTKKNTSDCVRAQ